MRDRRQKNFGFNQEKNPAKIFYAAKFLFSESAPHLLDKKAGVDLYVSKFRNGHAAFETVSHIEPQRLAVFQFLNGDDGKESASLHLPLPCRCFGLGVFAAMLSQSCQIVRFLTRRAGGFPWVCS